MVYGSSRLTNYEPWISHPWINKLTNRFIGSWGFFLKDSPWLSKEKQAEPPFQSSLHSFPALVAAATSVQATLTNAILEKMAAQFPIGPKENGVALFQDCDGDFSWDKGKLLLPSLQEVA